MADQLVHRGPDDSGQWFDPDVGIAIGHRRLSIVDLSEQGHQPMISQYGRYVIAFNGEIYNFNKLRKELACCHGISWRGSSDTEVLLAGIEVWGLEEVLLKVEGMFALAVWDREARILRLARDRMGEKPLYYGWQNGVFMFASELKALRVHPAFLGELDRNALMLFLHYNYIPAPFSIYSGIMKLPAGSIVNIKLDDSFSQQDPIPYWSLNDVVNNRKLLQDSYESDEKAVGYLDKLLGEVISEQLVADVPVGAFLSGGIDSSTVVALMQAHSQNQVKTFSIGFHEEGYNEAIYADKIAAHLGTDHTELYVSSNEAMDVIPHLPLLYDEPFSDISQIPTYLIAKLARQQITVSLTGDGGDELFGGYERHYIAANIWNKFNKMPVILRRLVSSGIYAIPESGWNQLLSGFNRVFPDSIKTTKPGYKLYKLAAVINALTPEELYQKLVSCWMNPLPLANYNQVNEGKIQDDICLPDDFSVAESIMYYDALSYLPDDILVKVDRATMGVGLESRIPMLNHKVVEYAWGLPLSMKIRDGKGKWILREVLHRYVPKRLIERPKMGFSVPIDSWLRGPLKCWAEELLAETRLREQGYLNPEPIRRKWEEHLSGKRNWQYQLWNVLMFQAWLDTQ